MQNFNKVYVWAALGFIVMLPLFYMDYGSKEYPELNRGINIVRHISSDRQLKRSAFPHIYPEGGPEKFVEWIFSPMGSSIWPATEGGVEFSLEEEKMMRKAGIPFLPSGISLVANNPDEDKERQVVISGDNELQMLIVEAYLDPKDDPVLVKEWRFLPERDKQD
jgi:hypothetical protein